MILLILHEGKDQTVQDMYMCVLFYIFLLYN